MIYLIKEEVLKEILEEKISFPIGDRKDSAVLIPLIKKDNTWHIIFQVRSKTMRRQPGEISLPGGRKEKNESFRQTALRETMEELNLDKENINILGELNYLHVGKGSVIKSFLGVISGVNVDKIEPNLDEVDHLFTVPIEFFIETEPRLFHLKTKPIEECDFPFDLIPNGRNYTFSGTARDIYFYNYNGYTIWGYTADIINDFITFYKSLDKF